MLPPPPHTHRHAHTPTPPHTHTHTHTHTRAHTQTHTQASGRTRPPLQLARVRGLRRQPRSFWPLGCGRPPAGRESPPGGDTPAAAATHRPGQVAGSRGLERVGRRPPHLLPAVRRQSRAHAHGGYAGAHPPSHAHTRGVTLALTRRHTHTHTHTTHSHGVQPQARPLAHTLIQMYTHSATYWDTPSNRHIHGHTQTHTPSPRYTHAIQSRHAETYSAHPPPTQMHTPSTRTRAHTQQPLAQTHGHTRAHTQHPEMWTPPHIPAPVLRLTDRGPGLLAGTPAPRPAGVQPPGAGLSVLEDWRPSPEPSPHTDTHESRRGGVPGARTTVARAANLAGAARLPGAVCPQSVRPAAARAGSEAHSSCAEMPRSLARSLALSLPRRPAPSPPSPHTPAPPPPRPGRLPPRRRRRRSRPPQQPPAS